MLQLLMYALIITQVFIFSFQLFEYFYLKKKAAAQEVDSELTVYEKVVLGLFWGFVSGLAIVFLYTAILRNL